MGLKVPNYIKKGYGKDVYYDKEEKKYKIKKNVPEWVKKEFEEYQKYLNPKADESGLITQY